MKWIVNFILEQEDKDAPMITFVNAFGIDQAIEAAGDLLDEEYPDRRTMIRSISVADDQDMPNGFIKEDPVCLEDDDVKMLAWWRK